MISCKRLKLRRFFICLLLFFLLAAPLMRGVEFAFHHLVYASPGGPYVFESHPDTHTTDITVSDPAKAYDNDTDTYASFSRDVAGYFEVGAFAENEYYESPPPRPPTVPSYVVGYIEQVDFKMRFRADAGGDDLYRIVYVVSPSTTATLVGWTSAGHSLDTYVWADQPEPKDGAWSWTDIANVKFRVEVETVGSPDGKSFDEYEAWLTVSYDMPIVAVDPPTITDPTLEAGDQFSIDITVDYVEELWSYQFEMSFNPAVLQGVSVANGPFLASAGAGVATLPGQGFDNTAGKLSLFAAHVMMQDLKKCPTGGGVLATVTFEVAGVGVSPLTLGDETALLDKAGEFIVKPGLYNKGYFDETLNKWIYHLIPECVRHGQFSNTRYALTIDSAPITGVSFTLDGDSYETPFSGDFAAGSYTIEMPAEWTVDATVYSFIKWEDDPTAGPTRTIELSSDTSLTATYIAGEFTLEINSEIDSTPLTGVSFTLDGDPYQTPFSETRLAGSHTIEMPFEWKVNGTLYRLLKWEDSSTDPIRVVALSSNRSLTATYTEVATYTLTIDSTPVTGVEFDLDFRNSTVRSYETPFSQVLLAGSYIVEMPLLWEVSEDTYEFYAWTDLVMDPQRTISLTSNRSLTALYVLGVKRYTLEINATTVGSTSLLDVSFKLDGAGKTTPSSDLLKAKQHVIQMPPESEVGGTRYWFVNWTDDGSTSSTRVVDLAGDRALTAVYTNRSVHNVNQDTYYEKIQWAIENATADDTIEVYPKTYYERLTIHQPLRLVGKDPNTTIIDGNATAGDLICVEAENVSVSGFTLQNSGGHGVYLSGSKGGVLSGNVISHSAFFGVYLLNSNDTLLSHNTLFMNAWAGVYLEASNNISIYANVMTLHRTYPTSFGVGLGNYGPRFALNNTIVANTISSNSVGLWIGGYCDNTVVYHNNFLSNEQDQVFFLSVLPRTVWDDGYPSGGNYWSDYTGVDEKSGPNQDEAGSDGIGDTPYHIDADHNDTYPLMDPWARLFDVAWDGATYQVRIMSNSTITAFEFSQLEKQISFNVTGPDGTAGFCEMNIQKALLDAQLNEWAVLVNGAPVTPDPKVTPGTLCNLLYFTYNHSTATVEIEGTIVVDDIPPIANATLTDPPIVNEDEEAVTFDGSASYDDVSIENYTWTFVEAGSTTVLVGEIKDYTFETPGFYLVTLEVTDSGDNSDTDTVLITVRDITPPVADASETSTTVDEDTSVTLDGRKSSDNVDVVEYTWYVDGVPEEEHEEIQTYEGWVDPGVYNVTLLVWDAAGNNGTHTIWITVSDTTDPVADASKTPTEVNEDTLVTLDGTASHDTVGGVGVVSHTWTFIDGTPQTLEGNITTYTFVTPGVYRVTLNVSDAAGNWDTTQLDITVFDITRPIADAGLSQTVYEDTLVTFDGSGSWDNDPLHDLNYTWTFFNGTQNITLTGVKPTYNFTTPGDYTVTLNVTDAAGNWDTEKIIIVVRDATDPIAVADVSPSETVDEDTLVTFDGSNSTDNTGIESYTWTFFDVNWTFMDVTWTYIDVTLTGVNPPYTFHTPGVYTVTLKVTDAEGKWHTDTIVITILDITPPIANAGLNQTIDEDTLMTFDGSRSWDNDPFHTSNYTWAFRENGKLQTLTGVRPNYIFTTPGVYMVNLTVADAAGYYAVDEVQITVLAAGPVADAGPDQTVDEDTLVTLNGSASWDSDPGSLTNYTWTFTDGTPQTLEGNVTTYTFATPDVYIITLNVTNVVGEWDIDEVMITVVDVTKPIADAGLNQTVYEDALMVFDGSGSTDNVGIESYVWTFTEGDMLRTLTGVGPNYIFVNPGDYKVTLNVTDAAGYRATDTVTISVLAHGSGSLPTWDIVFLALAGVALAIGIFSFMRRGSKE